jgi:PAS domain S-box-containing protein
MFSARPLRLWLAPRIALAGLVPLAVVAALVLGVLLPQLRADLEIRHQTLARAIAGQIEIHLLGAGRELRAIAQDLRDRGDQPPSSWFGPLDAHAGTGDMFAAIYITDSGDSVYSVGLPHAQRGQRDDLLGLDLSKWAALREVRERNKEMWSETFLSAVTGRLAVTLAIPVAEHTLVGEIAIDRLSEFIGHSTAESGLLTMILDRRGQIIAHSRAALSGQQLGLGHLPIVGDALRGQFATRSFELDGETFVGTSVGVPQLGWVVLVAQPRSEAFRPFLSTLWVLAAGALVALLSAILVAWALARGFARRIGRYAEQAHAIAEGDYDQPWPISRIQEFNNLASDLERMSLAIRQRERDLATSEARFRSVIGNAPVVLFQLDEHGIFTFSEGKGLAGIGLAPGEAVGQSVFELYRDYPEICDYARRAVGGEALQFISRFGETFFDTYFNPGRDGDGAVQVMGVAVDITERQRAEEALRQANLVVENSPAMLFRWKAEDGWPVAFVSHNVTQLGYSPEELLDGSFRFASLVYPEDLERIGHELRGYSERGVDQFQQEYRVVAKDGAVRWIDDRTVVERNLRGEITHYQGIVIDITERKRAEKELQLARLSILWSSDAVFWIMSDGRFINVNEQACDSLGYARDELLSMSVWDIDPDFSPQRWSPHWERTQQLKKRRFETRHRRKDGTIFPVEITANYIEYEGQEYDFAFVRDVTDRKRAEEALRRSNRQLRMLSDCNQALIRITDEMELLTAICAITVREGGYRMAWVGYAEQDASKTIRPMVHTGFEEGYLQNLNITWADDERGIGPMGTAIRTERPCLVRHIASDSRFAPWRAEAAQRGYAAVCALPLVASDQIFGALGIYSSAPDSFDAEEIDLLSELASDLAFGIAVLRARVERERTNRALAESEFFLRRSQEVGDLGSYYFDARTGTWISSEKLDQIFGIDGAFPKTTSGWIELVHPDHKEEMRQHLTEHVLAKHSKFDKQYRIVRHDDGQERWVHGLGELEFDESGAPIKMIGTIQDITQSKRADEALRASEALLAKMTADAPAMIYQFLLRPDGTSCFPYASAWCWEMFGVPPEALRESAAPLLDLILPEDRLGFEESVARSARTLEPWRYEYRLRSARGDIVWHQGISRPERQADGSILWSGIFFDTTERKRAEEELQRYREHLEELVAERTAELRQAMTQLVQAEKLAALGHLVAGVAHELNTPLGNARVIASSLGEVLGEFAVAVESGALRRSQVDAFLGRGTEAVELLERNTARAADLIAHFKQVAVDQASARRRRFDLRQTVEELLVTLRPQFKRTAHRIELDIPADLELDSYPGPLEQIIANLVSNSLVHGFAGTEAGLIRVHAAPLGSDRVQIDYADDGAGIPETILKRVFEPFFTTRLGQGGSGLGLYIVYNLVTGALGGTIRADSSPGAGVTFTLIVPRIAPDHDGPEAPSPVGG